MAEEIPT